MKKYISFIKKSAIVLFSLATVIGTVSCNSATAGGNANGDKDDGNKEEITIGNYAFSLSSFDKQDKWESSAPNIIFNGNSVSSTSANVSVNGTVATVKGSGTYILSGELTDGQIIVEVPDTDNVQLVLSDAKITSSFSSCIWVKSANKVVITIAEGTTNTLSDASAYDGITETNNEPSGCIFSKSDLTINGKGTLIVNGNFNNGIITKDDLKILDGTVIVSAENNGIKGKDSVVIMGGNISVKKSDDGIKCSNDADTDKGFVYIGGGEITIIAYDDAIQSTKAIYVKGGKVTYNCGDNATNCDYIVEVGENLLVEG